MVEDSGMSASGGFTAWRAGIGCCQLRRAPNVRYPPTQRGARGVGFGTRRALIRKCVLYTGWKRWKRSSVRKKERKTERQRECLRHQQKIPTSSIFQLMERTSYLASHRVSCIALSTRKAAALPPLIQASTAQRLALQCGNDGGMVW